ncbi:MAG: Mrp/NBP35 family ATP-binding protein [Candidatus Sumerlaeota bacterium]|nr:Mrp/NBP35 family ATP-binding protein [Candidatus Sumerlaeota bacterium]
MPSLRDQVWDVLKTVQDPELRRDLVSLNMVKRVEETDGRVQVQIELTTPACPLRNVIEEQARSAIAAIPGVQSVEVVFSANVAGRRAEPQDLAPGVRNIIGVASGKGGVGKSTISVNLALSLRRLGARVGLLDADIYGPNIPIMVGLSEPPLVSERQKMVPLEAYGIKVISMGFLISEDEPVVWRGPMLNSALRQLFGDVEWGELDYLIVDLPPGTGDVQISLVQLVPVTGCVLVTTPQAVALQDARKGVAMFRLTKTPVLGLIENMSYFICPHGERVEIFAHGGGRRVAEQLGIPFLGEIALDTHIRVGGDSGKPIVAADPDSDVAGMFLHAARELAAQASITNLGGRTA